MAQFTIPVRPLIGRVFITMAFIGDYNENPFEDLMNDATMISLCRTIRIGLRQMTGAGIFPSR